VHYLGINSSAVMERQLPGNLRLDEDTFLGCRLRVLCIGGARRVL